MFERVLLTCALASAAALAVGGASFGAIPSARPAPADRKFNSSAVESLIAAFLPRFLDPDIGTMFSNCLPNTLDTAIVSASHNDTFVITGDIPAMWLRDSTNEVLPYMALAADNADPALADKHKTSTAPSRANFCSSNITG